MQTILVSGGAGYVGSHVAKLLASNGFVPVVLDNLSTGNRWAVKWGPLVEGNVGDARLVCETVKKYHVVAAIHLAASAYVGESVENPRKYYRNNVVESLNFFDALLSSGIDKVVFSSTCAVYGNVTCTTIDEAQNQKPVNPYGETKLFVERALHGLDVAHGLKSIRLRYFNAAGADPDGEIGEAHDPETHLIPLVIDAALGLRESVAVFGVDYPTEDGSAVRDYTHVYDLARAHVLALRSLFAGGQSQALNLGTGNGHSVLDIIKMVEVISGAVVPKQIGLRRHGDPPRLVASARAAETVLGWHPEYSRLEAIIGHAWRWHSKANKGSARPATGHEALITKTSSTSA
jgi:UDP-arabinose 4-epimerase